MPKSREDHAQVPTLPTERRETLLDWDGPSDPENPRNFPVALRLFTTVTVTVLALVSVFAGAIYAPAQNYVRAEFDLSYEVAVLPLSLYNLGLAFGPIIGAPLSETYGRKTVFVITTPVFIFFMIGSGFAKSIDALNICRFFAGMFASSNISNASATMLDYTPDLRRGLVLGIYYCIPSFTATLAPLIGGFVVMAKGWRWTQWTAIMVATAAYIPILFTKETYKKVILQRRAVRLGLEDSASQRVSVGTAVRHFFTTLIQRPVHMILTEPIVTFVSLYNGFNFGLLYAFVITVPWMMRTYYGFNKTSESLSYLGMTIGTLIACLPFILIDTFIYQKRFLAWRQTHSAAEKFPPKYRLLSSMVGSILLPPSLFAVAWTVQYRVHWIVPILFQGLSMLSCMLVYAGVNLFMLDSYGPLYGASASGAVQLSRYILSFAFPLFALRMAEGLGAGWSTSLLGIFTVLLVPIPWCFWRFGDWLREHSRYEISD
ncbi:unnamed protein product [Clonostachys rosea]|uniref:Major facilitator superfamily (MFS) profile domain-containing protein n=1 Tax=Bionectria ochroleuca TaxID=29856 RepID=A0ABY6UIZ6_BIOOC|nr:unnamed protein product [Clonostachys rosea]